MQEQLIQGLGFARAILRRRKLAIIIAWAVCAVAWGAVLMLPNRFEASARVYVDSLTPLRPVLQGIAVEEDFDSQVSLVREALLTRPQLEAVARKTDLDATVKTPAGMDGLISALKSSIEVIADAPKKQDGSAARDTVYTITYKNSNRDKSIAVVRALLDNFVEGTMNGNRSGATEAQSFLTSQIADYEKRLTDAEARLAEFKRRNVGMIPGDRGDYFSRLDKEMNGLQESQTNLAIAASRREELRRQLQGAKPYVPGTSGAAGGAQAGGAASDLSLRVQEAEARLEDLLLRYTDKHPEVLALKETIRELKAREAKEMAELARGGPGTGAIRSLSANPVYQSIQVQLNQVEVELASLRGAVAQHQTEIGNLRKFVNLAPEVEQEFARLNRDYGVTKAQYEALVKRLEQAKVSDSAAQTGTIRFQVIDPPRADINPVWPNRPMLIIAGLVAGILIGVMVALGRHLLSPTFDETGSLARETGLPVLGAISRVKATTEDALTVQSDRRLVMAGVALGVLSAVLFMFSNTGARLIHHLLA
jgi:polysaccharide chain length determinant protein (PEP-CTERM system associated)